VRYPVPGFYHVQTGTNAPAASRTHHRPLSRVSGVSEHPRPAPLLLAAVLVGVEALALAVQAVLEVVHLDADRIVLGVTTTVFFAGLAAGLGWCARGLAQVESWARGPVVALQLIGVLTAFSFWGGSTTLVAAVLGVGCVLILVGVLHPASTHALASAAYGDDEGVDEGPDGDERGR
jgi:hypothetical protein